MSHVHWDHIMGFPFFGPAYVPGTRIRIHGCHDNLELAYRLQQSPPCFPVSFDQLGAPIEFVRLPAAKPMEVSGLKVTGQLQRHSGDSYGYRFELGGRSVVYTTDSEHKLEDRAQTAAIVSFFRDADLVIFDAMYSLAEAISVKEDWGHSSNVAGAKHLVLFHHEPANSDAAIEGALRDARRLEELTRGAQPLRVSAAHDGLEIDL
jgi:phosphoribosyl 1,2-cyclic phosphodiesterase